MNHPNRNKHPATQGPWFIGARDENGTQILAEDNDGPSGAAMAFVGRVFSKGDVSVIAAAPDLLEALKRANYWIAKQYGTIMPVDAQTVYEFARKAIDKAEGREVMPFQDF